MKFYLILEPPKQSDRFLTNWGQWLSCNESSSTAKLRTRQWCVTNLSRQWSCGKQDVERKHQNITKLSVVQATTSMS